MSTRSGILLAIACVVVAGCANTKPCDIEGNAAYRERMALPPIRFTMPYYAGKIDPSLTYAVRAVIRVDGRLWFTSDTHYPVLTRGAGNTVDVLLKRVP